MIKGNLFKKFFFLREGKLVDDVDYSVPPKGCSSATKTWNIIIYIYIYGITCIRWNNNFVGPVVLDVF